jgi:hypothetical protein
MAITRALSALRKRVMGLLVGVVLVAGRADLARAQSPDATSAPSDTARVAGSTLSADHASKPTEPPPFDPNEPAARAARAKAANAHAVPAVRSDATRTQAPARSAATSVPSTPQRSREAKVPPPQTMTSAPTVRNTPARSETQPGRAAREDDPWAEPVTSHTPPAGEANRGRADRVPTPAQATRPTTRRRSEPARIVGIDSLGHSSEEPSQEQSPAR